MVPTVFYITPAKHFTLVQAWSKFLKGQRERDKTVEKRTALVKKAVKEVI